MLSFNLRLGHESPGMDRHMARPRLQTLRYCRANRPFSPSDLNAARQPSEHIRPLDNQTDARGPHVRTPIKRPFGQLRMHPSGAAKPVQGAIPNHYLSAGPGCMQERSRLESALSSANHKHLLVPELTELALF